MKNISCKISRAIGMMYKLRPYINPMMLKNIYYNSNLLLNRKVDEIVARIVARQFYFTSRSHFYLAFIGAGAFAVLSGS